MSLDALAVGVLSFYASHAKQMYPYSKKKIQIHRAKKNHYTSQGLEGCHKEFYYFSSFNEQVDCAYCNFHRAPLNNSVTFSVRSFHSGGCSLQWHHGRVPQSRHQENTHTHALALPPTTPVPLSVLSPSITPVNRTAPHF